MHVWLFWTLIYQLLHNSYGCQQLCPDQILISFRNTTNNDLLSTTMTKKQTSRSDKPANLANWSDILRNPPTPTATKEASAIHRVPSGPEIVASEVSGPAPTVDKVSYSTHQVTSFTTHNVSLSYLKTFITILVVAHHSVLAYTPYLQVSEFGSWKSLIFPVLQPERLEVFIELIMFNDSFFMAFMFFLSGLFAWTSISKYGPVRYLENRIKRLGIPFFISFAIAPFVFFPAYLARTPESSWSIPDYVRTWTSLGYWPCGSGWFIGVLLVIDSSLAALFSVGSIRGLVESGIEKCSSNPRVFFITFFLASAAAYLPLANIHGEDPWLNIGVFQIQHSRALLYPLYFFAGVFFGGKGLRSKFLLSGGPDAIMAPYWKQWTTAAVINWIIWRYMRDTTLVNVWNFLLVTSSFIYTFAFISLFLRFAERRSATVDCLTINAYGIYVFHYLVTTWAQYFLLPAALGPAMKGLIVFVIALSTSGALASFFRKHTALHNVL